ncbi:MAG: WHG domain-containing protein, partial [Clostridia bacterium]|nr:WHG domain-containing protein [Clostridia bacterium]
VFSNFATMAELRLAVVEKADALYEAYIQKEVESGLYPAFKASGMAYIRFAREEKQLFRLLYMRDLSNENHAETTEGYDRMLSIVQGSTGLDSATAKLFHLESWAFVHGIATMFATGYLDLDWELVSNMLTDAYMGLRKRYEEKE